MIVDTLEGAKNVNRAALENVERMIWQNPYGMTPQQVFDLLGTRAAGLLSLKDAILPMLDLAFPNEVVDRLKPQSVMLTVNADGTVTVAE
jgi:hypothetical protein